MSRFSDEMRTVQIAWKANSVSTAAKRKGRQNGKNYDHVLPSNLWEENLWEGIRSGTADSLPAYLEEFRVQRHTGTHNLLSSWVVCANLYFPFRKRDKDHALLAGFLRERVASEVIEVTGLELEYQLPEAQLRPGALLGEQGGGRGSGQTSPDVAFLVRTKNGRGVILTESKFTEHSFYGCSARKSGKAKTKAEGRPRNPAPEHCKNALEVLNSPATQCHQEHAEWGRRYWDHLAPVATRERFAELACCPAAINGYQLLRQQALAEGVANSGSYDLVVSAVAYDARNETLHRSLATTGVASVEGWARLFVGKARFKTFTHQHWVAWVRENGGSRWARWLRYVADRYGY